VTQNSAPKGVVLVTGGAKRLGKEIALGFARAGWDVCVHYGQSEREALETVREIQALGRRSACIQADLANEPSVRQLIPACREIFGSAPRCLVNNASMFEHDTATDLNTAMLLKVMATNLAAPLVLSRDFHAALPASAGEHDDERGVIINILDMKLFALQPDHLSYTLAKSALHTATGLLAQSLAPRVRVVGVAPGLTMKLDAQSAHTYERARTLTPLGQTSRPEDIVQACLYLAHAPSATGTTLVVDGGQHLMPQARDTLFLFE
jgi:NAD(P)-dependent dehydrogenase (short-subunit alcohol dehydrogenase family)